MLEYGRARHRPYGIQYNPAVKVFVELGTGLRSWDLFFDGANAIRLPGEELLR